MENLAENIDDLQNRFPDLFSEAGYIDISAVVLLFQSGTITQTEYSLLMAFHAESWGRNMIAQEADTLIGAGGGMDPAYLRLLLQDDM